VKLAVHLHHNQRLRKVELYLHSQISLSGEVLHKVGTGTVSQTTNNTEWTIAQDTR
jgi:hypothetical protein